MARVTVEDCLGSVENRFELVLLASKRARQVAKGVQPFVELDNDKPTVIALREIAGGYVTRDLLTMDDSELAAEAEFGGEQPTAEGSGE